MCQRGHFFGHIGGIDNEGLAASIGRREADVLQQPLQHRVQPPGADILNPVVDVGGEFGQRIHCVVAEVQRHVLCAEQRRVLF